MSKKLFLFGVIASVVTINSAFSVTSTVTSRDYVDAVVATKQPKIPATGTNAATPGDTVVTYTSTGDGTIGERGIYDGFNGSGWHNEYSDNDDSNKLVSAFVVEQLASCLRQMTEYADHDCVERDSNGDCLLVRWSEENHHSLEECYFRLFKGGGNKKLCRTDNDCSNGQTCCPSSEGDYCTSTCFK